MRKRFCDICGLEIEHGKEKWHRYKMKREDYCWDHFYWTRFEAHDLCMRMLCEEVTRRMEARDD